MRPSTAAGVMLFVALGAAAGASEGTGKTFKEIDALASRVEAMGPSIDQCLASRAEAKKEIKAVAQEKVPLVSPPDVPIQELSFPAVGVSTIPAAPVPSFCSSDFRTEALATDPALLAKVVADTRQAYGRMSQAGGSMNDIKYFASCEAFATDDLAWCDRLSAADAALSASDPARGKELWKDCQHAALGAQVARAAISGNPPLPQVCDQLAAHRDFAQDRLELIVCGSLAARAAPLAACEAAWKRYAAARKGGTKALKLNECVLEVQALQGRADCSKLGDGERMLCEGLRAYRKASAARSPAECGDFVMCRAMMGGGARACLDYARKSIGEFCDARRALAPKSVPEAQLKAELAQRQQMTELHRKQLQQHEELRRKMVDEYRGRVSGDQKEQGRALAHYNEVDAKCVSMAREMRGLVDQLSARASGFEPKSDPDLQPRLEKAQELAAKANAYMKKALPCNGARKGDILCSEE